MSKLRQENLLKKKIVKKKMFKERKILNPGGRGYSEPRWHHGTAAWATRARLYLKKKQRNSTRCDGSHL